MLPSVSRVSRVHDVVFTRIRVYTMSLGRYKRTHRLVTHILGIKKKSQKEKKQLYFILTIIFFLLHFTSYMMYMFCTYKLT